MTFLKLGFIHKSLKLKQIFFNEVTLYKLFYEYGIT